MTKPTILALALGLVVGFLGAAPAAHAGPRPTSELALFQSLNGEVYRELNAVDGGGLTLFTFDAGIGCNTVTTGAIYKLVCDSPVHFCPWGDGGCSSAISSQNYGDPVNASTPSAPYNYYFVVTGDLNSTTKLVCMTPASGDPTAICAPLRLK